MPFRNQGNRGREGDQGNGNKYPECAFIICRGSSVDLLDWKPTKDLNNYINSINA